MNICNAKQASRQTTSSVLCLPQINKASSCPSSSHQSGIVLCVVLALCVVLLFLDPRKKRQQLTGAVETGANTADQL
jgi:hypothetical protein